MLDRQKVEAILNRRFAGAPAQEIAAAANAIMGLASESQDLVEARPNAAERGDIRTAKQMRHESDRRHLARRTG